jgi:hypothetical protein
LTVGDSAVIGLIRVWVFLITLWVIGIIVVVSLLTPRPVALKRTVGDGAGGRMIALPLNALAANQ